MHHEANQPRVGCRIVRECCRGDAGSHFTAAFGEASGMGRPRRTVMTYSVLKYGLWSRQR